MSFRTRLILLYTTQVGGIFLLFGFAIYQLISFTLKSEVDGLLIQTASDIIKATRLQASDDASILPQPNLVLAANVYIQLWDRNRALIDSSPNIVNLRTPLDQSTINIVETDTTDVWIGDAHLRVLSVPLSVGSRSFGTLQIASSFAIVDAAQQTILAVLILGVFTSMAVAAIAVWFSTNWAFDSLDSVTETALQITRADDLSRRIPYQGPPEDEIGQLILAFNQTLERLENLFVSQRRFLADVGHELRTPLTVIKGNVDLLKRMNCVDEEYLLSINAEVDRLTRMVGDILLLAQAESGKLPLDLRLVELDTLLLEVFDQTRILIKNDAKMEIIDIDQVIVCGDRDRLKQVLLNLISNAIHYTPENGSISIKLNKSGSDGMVTISNTGPGIKEEDIPLIFERFYRTETSRTRKSGKTGYGLGLSIAYWIVKNHDGQIEAQSIPDEITTFTVKLPLAEEGCSRLTSIPIID